MNTENFTIDQNDVDQANEKAKDITVEKIPSIIMSAMAGGSSSDNADDGDAKGLILTKYELQKIREYVAFGLTLPLDDAGISEKMPYTDNKGVFNTKKYKKIFQDIHDHCLLWSALQSDTSILGVDIDTYAGQFVINGSTIIDIINAMPVIKQATTTIGEDTDPIPFAAEDRDLIGTLSEILNIMRKDINSFLKRVNSLSARMSSYRETMDNTIVPEVNILDQAIDSLSVTKELAAKRTARAKKDSEIATLSKTYDKMVGYAFTGTTGLVFGPIGIVSWAITGGIYGKKAETARKKLKVARSERDTLDTEIAMYDKMNGAIAKMKTFGDNTSVVIQNAVAGIQHLDMMWKAVDAYIESSINELNSVDDSTKLIIFKGRMQSATNSWEQVGGITSGLLEVFK